MRSPSAVALVLASSLSCSGPAVGWSRPPAEHQTRATPTASALASAAPSAVTTEPLEPSEPDLLVAFGEIPAQVMPAGCTDYRRVSPAVPASSDLCDTPGSASKLLADGLAHFARARTAQARWPDECRENALASAPMLLTTVEALRRDAQLYELETCRGFPIGYVRALRAALAGRCASIVAAPFLAELPEGVEARWAHALVGASLAAQLADAAPGPPAFVTRDTAFASADRHLEKAVLPWVTRERNRLLSLKQVVVRLPRGSYGGAVARIALANAWQTFRVSARSFPIPAAWKKSYELRSAFYSRLSDATEASFAGALEDIHEAREELAFTGLLEAGPDGARFRFIEALPRVAELSKVLLPPVRVPEPVTEAAVLAATLPPFFVPESVDAAAIVEPATLSAMLLGGASPETRRLIEAARPSGEARGPAARLYLLLALRSGSPGFARRAARYAAGDETNLTGALASTLGALPDDFAVRGDGTDLPASTWLPLVHYRGSDHAPLLRALAGANEALLRTVMPTRDLSEVIAMASDARSLWPDRDLMSRCLESGALLLRERDCPCPLRPWR